MGSELESLHRRVADLEALKNEPKQVDLHQLALQSQFIFDGEGNPVGAFHILSEDSIVISDTEARILDANEAMLKMYDADEKQN